MKKVMQHGAAKQEDIERFRELAVAPREGKEQ
jgi:hypothetical protein